MPGPGDTKVMGMENHQFSDPFELNDVDRPQKYDYLFEISPTLKDEMKGKSLGLILMECTLMSLKLNREGNKLTLIFKRESAEKMNEIIKVKVKSYDQVVKNIALPCLEAAITLAGLGGGQAEIFSRAWSAAARGADNQLGNAHQAELAGLDHLYKIQNDMSSQNDQSKQEARQSFEALVRIFEQFQQQMQEAFRVVASST